jgi:mono/diheme cytochrome c family protein
MRWFVTIGCTLLLVVGCGPNDVSPAPARSARVKRPAPPADPVQYGRQIFAKYGCVMCHGADAKSGIANPNAKTLDKIPPLTYVADGYTADELKKFIRRGQPVIDKKKPDGPTPPFRMPAFAKWIPNDELDALQKYLFSLMPAGEKETF